MEKKRLTRSNNRMIGGVCAGIADYFEWDITLVRIIYVLATFFTAFSGGLVFCKFYRRNKVKQQLANLQIFTHLPASH